MVRKKSNFKSNEDAQYRYCAYSCILISQCVNFYFLKFTTKKKLYRAFDAHNSSLNSLTLFVESTFKLLSPNNLIASCVTSINSIYCSSNRFYRFALVCEVRNNVHSKKFDFGMRTGNFLLCVVLSQKVFRKIVMNTSTYLLLE